MAYVTPGTVAAGDVATAAAWNVVVGDIVDHELYVAGIRTGWSTWTTTVTQSVTVAHTVNYARYLQIGRLVIATCNLSMTGNGTGNNAIFVSLPITPSTSITNGTNIGTARIIDQNIADYSVFAMKNSNSVNFTITGTTSSAGSQVGANPNFALTSTDVINMTIMYESAT